MPRAVKILGHEIEVFASAETMSGIKGSLGYLFVEKAATELEREKIIWKNLPNFGNFEVQELQLITA